MGSATLVYMIWWQSLPFLPFSAPEVGGPLAGEPPVAVHHQILLVMVGSPQATLAWLKRR
jgi:hypothetical protein